MVGFGREREIPIGPVVDGAGSGTQGNLALNGTDIKLAWITQAGTTDPITRAWARVLTTAGVPPEYYYAIKNVDTSVAPVRPGLTTHLSKTFTPSGAGNTDYPINFSGSYSPADPAELIALEIGYSSGTINSSNRATFLNAIACLQSVQVMPNFVTYNGTTWSNSTSGAVLGYGTASQWFGRPAHTFSSTALAASTDGHRACYKFRIPEEYATLDVIGFNLFNQQFYSAGSTVRAVLCSASSTLATVDVPTNLFRTTARGTAYRFGTVVTLSAGVDYYVGFQRFGMTVYMPAFTLPGADYRSAFTGGSLMCGSTFNGTVWTDNTSMICPVSLLCTGFTAAGGGGGASGMSRGRVVNLGA